MKKESISVKVIATKQKTKRKDSSDGGALSSDTGELIFREFDEKLGFSQTIAKHLHLKDQRSFYIHSNELLLRQKIDQLIAGYHEDDAADCLTHDPVFTQVLGTPALASQPSSYLQSIDFIKIINSKR